MFRQLSVIALSAGMLVYALSSCKHEPFDLTKGDFPEDISRIVINKCATTGCHDAAGAVNAARLRLDSWDELFKGSSHGAVVIPYSPKYSTLLYYINVDAHANNDIVATPTMPYNMSPLTEAEYNAVKNWIANGAPNADGVVAFASEAETRQKVYMTQQGCDDQIAVIDAKSGLVMRYIAVGTTGNSEKPHNVRVSPDGKYAYVCFAQGQILQKIDTRTDQVVSAATLELGSWNVLNLSADGSKLFVSDLSNHRIAYINTDNMAVINLNFLTDLTQAHGIASSPSFDTVYITSQNTNVVYRFTPNDLIEPVKEIYLKGTEKILGYNSGNPNPHEIMISPDNQKFIVTCENTRDVRIVDVDSLYVDSIAVGILPREMAYSKKRKLLFVTCVDDVNNYSPKSRGSVYVIDLSTRQVVGLPIKGDFFQPHGITVDEQNDLIYIASENIDVTGPTPHHSANCNGRNGWYSIYNLNTLQPINNIRYEVSPDPYGADVRFK